MRKPTIVIEGRFHGPEHSSNGGYACGRVAAFVDGPARVRLRRPPPLDVPLEVDTAGPSVRVTFENRLVAEGWPEDAARIDVPAPPRPEDAERASRRYSGFTNHRYPTCFVCGVDREPGDGLRVFAGPVEPRPAARPPLVACTWTPERRLSTDGGTVDPVFVWSVLDCPGGFSFPHPEAGTILLGELSVWRLSPVTVGERHVVIGWEIDRDGRRHRTGTALFSESGTCRGIGLGVWFEVPESVNV